MLHLYLHLYFYQEMKKNSTEKSQLHLIKLNKAKQKQQTPWPVARKRAIPTASVV
jgi:hypothetical protein